MRIRKRQEQCCQPHPASSWREVTLSPAWGQRGLTVATSCRMGCLLQHCPAMLPGLPANRQRVRGPWLSSLLLGQQLQTVFTTQISYPTYSPFSLCCSPPHLSSPQKLKHTLARSSLCDFCHSPAKCLPIGGICSSESCRMSCSRQGLSPWTC